MKKALVLLFSFLFTQNTYSNIPANIPEHCKKWPSWLQTICIRPYQTWTEGDNELYLAGYAWHNRYFYPEEKKGIYNETAWGGGLGKGFFDEHGDWHGLYAFAFLESHRKVEPIGGYAFLKTLHINENSSMGIGFTVFLTARPDILYYAPFPGVLPWAGLNYRKFAVMATYVPGSHGVGNVLFLLAKYTF